MSVAVVTSAAGGLRADTARQLAADAYRVACLDVDTAGATAVADAVQGSAAKALGLGYDISDETAVSRAIEATLDRFAHWSR